VVDTTQLRNDDEAQIRLDDYRAHGPHRLNTQDAIRTFGMRRGPGVTNTQTDTNPLSPTGPGQYQYTSTPIPGVQDVELDIPFAPQTLTRPGQDQQTFTGEWRVMVDGEEVYRFSGVGNNQGDANRVGQNWILQQIRQGTLTPVEGVDVEVLPVMR
jgi:hypothetical protein